MKDKHTPEPWRVHGVELFGSDEAGVWRTIAVADDDPIVRSADLADFRRIVACVNACAGIAADELEPMRNGYILALVRVEESVRLARAEYCVPAGRKCGTCAGRGWVEIKTGDLGYGGFPGVHQVCRECGGAKS